jgi:hypothetical protein
LKREQNPTTVRAIGGALILIGAALSWTMAWQLRNLQFMAQSGRWTGTPELTQATTGLFWSILVFGLIALAGGGFQVWTGRRSRLIALLTLINLVPIGYFVYRILG